MVHLLDGVQIVLSEGIGDAVDGRPAPVDRLSLGLAEFLHHEQLEIRLVVDEPVEIEEALVDDVLVGVALVLEDHGAHVLVDAQAVDAPALDVRAARLRDRVLGGEEPHAEERLHVLLDVRLDLLLEPHGV